MKNRFRPSLPIRNKVWVVFSDHADLPYLKILKRGFRHCFVLMNNGENWLVIDPMSHYLDFSILPVDVNYDLPDLIAQEGLCIMPAYPNRKIKKIAPWAFLTCVEIVKRFLGIHHRFIITPWQLYRFLRQQHYLTQ